MIWLFAKRHKDVHLGKIKLKEKFLDIKAEATHLSSIIKYEFINKDESHLVTHNRVNNLHCLLNFEYVTFYVFVFFYFLSTWKRGKYELCESMWPSISEHRCWLVYSK